MKKKLLFALGLLLVAGLLIASVGGATLSASPANNSGSYGNGNGVCDGTGTGDCTGTGVGIGGGLYNDSSDVCAAVCDLLGITQDELQTMRLDGLSLVEIAANYGVSEEELVAAIMEVKTAYIESLVADGTITQEQADVILANMLDRTYEMVNATDIGHYGGNGGNGGQGGNNNGSGGNSWGECSDGTGPGDQHQWGKNAR
jgi:hypothetical protein